MSDQKLKPNTSNLEAEPLPEILANSAIHRKYHLGRVLSKDFAGTLYACSHSMQEGREMAVKVLNPGYASVSNTLGNIDHSRVCKIRNIIIERDTIRAVVHEKPSGKSLTDHLKASGPMPPGEAVLAALQLLSAIHAVHWHGNAVGNLHADSVFLSRDTRGNLEVQLANLGIACTDDSLREQDYLAPEQIMGGKSPSKRSDIWASGALLYQMLMGRRPFVGENRYAVAGEILLQELNFERKNPKIPEDLLTVIRRSMEKDERNRYETISEMVAELMPFQSDFNEPMSKSAATAIHDSVPPAKTDDGVLPPVKSFPKAKAIPTVRISHTPSYPPTGLNPKKEAGKEITNRARPVMKTKLGMPAISIPAKHIPLRSKDDTSTFAAPKSETPLDLSAYTARKTRGEATETPRSPAHVLSSETNGKPSEAGQTKLQNTFEIKKSGAVIVSRVTAMIQGASPTQKKITAGALAGVVMLILLLSIFTDDDPPSTASKTNISPAAAAVVPNAALQPSKDTAAQAVVTDKALSSEATVTTAASATASEPSIEIPKIDITIKGRLPKSAIIRVGDRKVDSKLFSMDRAETPIEISIEASNYETFVEKIVPNQTQTVKVSMRKIRTKGAKPKNSKSKKKEKSDKNLASNPFGG